jgi:hypothetical protein
LQNRAIKGAELQYRTDISSIRAHASLLVPSQLALSKPGRFRLIGIGPLLTLVTSLISGIARRNFGSGDFASSTSCMSLASGVVIDWPDLNPRLLQHPGRQMVPADIWRRPHNYGSCGRDRRMIEASMLGVRVALAGSCKR